MSKIISLLISLYCAVVKRPSRSSKKKEENRGFHSANLGNLQAEHVNFISVSVVD